MGLLVRIFVGLWPTDRDRAVETHMREIAGPIKENV
jgi:hypothetical protein